MFGLNVTPEKYMHHRPTAS